MQYDAIIVGAGAAGLMCAIEAGRRGRRVAVVEHSERPGRKILISGGGRANFTNLNVTAANFLSANPHFAKSALARFTPRDFIARVERHGIPYHEKTLGQLFCNRTANDIVGMLETDCATAHVEMLLNARVTEVRRSTGFTLETNRGPLEAAALVIASGGLSVPKIGATDFGYRIARQFGLAVRPTYPALVPLVLNEEDRREWCDLAGVACEVEAGTGSARFREKALITHRGLSGPAILQISSYWKPGAEICLDLAPGRVPASAERKHLREWLPRRVADRWLELNPAPRPEQLHSWKLVPAGTEGFAKAEVTGGGVDTRELDSKTMQARRAHGLFFIGEVVDVTGWLGGYNFQWAWSSGYAAGQAL